MFSPEKDNAIALRAEGAQGGWGQEGVITVPILQTRRMRHRRDCDQLRPLLPVSGSAEIEPRLSSARAHPVATALSPAVTVITVCSPFSPAGLKGV